MSWLTFLTGVCLGMVLAVVAIIVTAHGFTHALMKSLVQFRKGLAEGADMHIVVGTNLSNTDSKAGAGQTGNKGG